MDRHRMFLSFDRRTLWSEFLNIWIYEKEPCVQMPERRLFFFFVGGILKFCKTDPKNNEAEKEHSRVHFWDNKLSAEFYVKMF